MGNSRDLAKHSRRVRLLAWWAATGLMVAALAVALVTAVAVASPPDLTGSWINPDSPSCPPWLLQSSSDRRDLTGSWDGCGVHYALRGTFSATLNGSGAAYDGTFNVTEGSVTGYGTITLTIETPDKLSVTYHQNNGTGNTFTLKRAATAAVEKLTGQVEFQLPGGTWQKLQPGQTLQPGTKVHTGFKSTVTLVIGRGTLALQPMSLLIVGVNPYLVIGEVGAQVGRKARGASDYEVKTATVTISVRGTILSVSYHAGSTTVAVTRGTVRVIPTNRKLKAVLVHAGYKVTVTRKRVSRITPIR